MRLPSLLAILVLVSVPLASAQGSGTVGTVTTHVEPEYLALDEPFVWVDGEPQRNEYSFVVFVEGTIACVPGTDPPLPIPVTARGTTATEATSGDETTTFFRIEPQEFEVNWVQATTGLNDYTASAEVTIAITNDGQPPTNITAELGWVGSLIEPQGSTNCNPNGYGWNIDETNHTVFIPGPPAGDTDTFGNGDGDEDSPAPLAAVALALGALAIAARRRTE